MRVFISWSGKKSQAVALKLREWLPNIAEAIEPWMSKEDIEAGARWNNEISKQLESCSFGIVCLTKSNQSKPWVMFEAGALAKVLDGAFLVPYLIDLSPAEVAAGPLSQFQAKRADKEGTLQMLLSLNSASGTLRPEERLRHLFNMLWPELETILAHLPNETDEPTEAEPARTQKEVIEEILVLVRGIAQQQTIMESPQQERSLTPAPTRVTNPRHDYDAEMVDITFGKPPHRIRVSRGDKLRFMKALDLLSDPAMREIAKSKNARKLSDEFTRFVIHNYPEMDLKKQVELVRAMEMLLTLFEKQSINIAEEDVKPVRYREVHAAMSKTVVDIVSE